jgi:hypothetical protein
MIETIIKHWCLYYMWLVRYFEKGRLKSGAKAMAERLLVSSILIYISVYIVLPLVILFSGESNPMREHRLLFLILYMLVAVPVFSLIGKSTRIKEVLEALRNVEDWYGSALYKKGKRIVLFHFVFSFLSVPLVIGMMILLSNLLGF